MLKISVNWIWEKENSQNTNMSLMSDMTTPEINSTREPQKKEEKNEKFLNELFYDQQ